MTVWRTGWGPVNVLLGRREEGLRKMMGFSCLFHLFLFAFLILNNTFLNPRTPSFHGFQVNLVAPGFGSPGSASGGGGGGLPKGRSASKKLGIRPLKVSTVSRTPAKHTPKAKQSKKAVQTRSKQSVPPKSGPPPLPRTPATKAVVKTKGPVARPIQKRTVLAKTVPPIQKDPERLEDWWTKQKKSLKIPVAAPRIKASKNTLQTTRTAKIDIKRRAIVAPPVRPILDQSAQDKEPLRERGPQSNALSQTDTEEETRQSFETSEDDTHETASNLASVGPEIRRIGPGTGIGLGGGGGPGIKGVGTGTGRGGGTFFFPSYLQTIDSKIRWQWAPPPIRSHEDSLLIRFVINKDGSIDESSIIIEESSGNIFFDQAGRRAVFAARPLPPLPKAYSQDSLIIYMNFIVKEDT